MLVDGNVTSSIISLLKAGRRAWRCTYNRPSALEHAAHDTYSAGCGLPRKHTKEQVHVHTPCTHEMMLCRWLCAMDVYMKPSYCAGMHSIEQCGQQVVTQQVDPAKGRGP